jgi:hypothetical protein
MTHGRYILHGTSFAVPSLKPGNEGPLSVPPYPSLSAVLTARVLTTSSIDCTLANIRLVETMESSRLGESAGRAV